VIPRRFPFAELSASKLKALLLRALGVDDGGYGE
jgi:hypothetical protein